MGEVTTRATQRTGVFDMLKSRIMKWSAMLVGTAYVVATGASCDTITEALKTLLGNVVPA
jgi:hypothetical protein